VASGKAHRRCFKRHTHLEFIAFLESLARRYPKRELHLICDNYGPISIRQSNSGCRSSALPSALHPTSVSWFNLVERWFALITSQAIRRGSFGSVRRLEQAILRYPARLNENAKLFNWTNSAAAITRCLNHVTAICETSH
jgi:hypothetical protein